MLAFIKAVGPALRARGWYVAVNAGMNDDGARAFTGETNDGTQYIWWFKQIGPYVSGINTEHWQQYWGNPGARADERRGLESSLGGMGAAAVGRREYGQRLLRNHDRCAHRHGVRRPT